MHKLQQIIAEHREVDCMNRQHIRERSLDSFKIPLKEISGPVWIFFLRS